MHGVSWEELAAAKVPALQALLRRAAVGAMNTRPLDSPEEFAPYVSIGAGRGAVTDQRSPQVSDQLLTWYITASLPERMPHIQNLRDANNLAHTQAEPGLLGSLLHQAGRRTGYLWVFPGKTRRLGAAIAMDRTGGVDWMDQTYPGERVLRDARHWSEADLIGEGLRRSDLLVIDLSISDALVRGRLQPPTPDAPDSVALSLLAGLDPFFRDIAQTVNTARDLLIITSPTCPPYRSPKQMAYAPIAIIGPGFGPGLLTSASTRRVGIVSNVDIAPTILRYFGVHGPEGRTHRTVGTEILRSTPRLRSSLPLGMTYSGQLPVSMSGHPIIARRAKQPLKQVLAISRRGVRLFDFQWRFAPVYAIGQFVAFLGVGAALAFAPAWARRSRRRLRIALMLAMSLPLALFFLGPLDPGGVAQPYIMVAALAAAFTCIAMAGSAPLTALGALLTATSAIIILDGITGAHLLSDYMINFAAMYGSRFYGIGNETMGFVVASAAIGSAALAQQAGATRGSLWTLGLWLVLVALVLGAPWWGANWGGAVTAAFAFTVTWAAIKAGRPRLRHWAVAIGPAVAAGVLVVALDVIGNARTFTHIGDSARLVNAGGLPAAVTIAVRKIQGNLRIMAIVPWLGITLAVCAAALWLVLKPPARLRAAFGASPVLWGGLAGGTAAAVVAVIVNDSGIVAASSAVGITASAMAYLALEGNGASP